MYLTHTHTHTCTHIPYTSTHTQIQKNTHRTYLDHAFLSIHASINTNNTNNHTHTPHLLVCDSVPKACV